MDQATNFNLKVDATSNASEAVMSPDTAIELEKASDAPNTSHNDKAIFVDDTEQLQKSVNRLKTRCI